MSGNEGQPLLSNGHLPTTAGGTIDGNGNSGGMPSSGILTRRGDEGSSLAGSTNSVRITMPPPERGSDRGLKPEKMKTVFAFLYMSVNMLLNLTVLAVVHERVPDRATSPPLPDVFFDLFAPVDWALDISEVIIIASVWSVVLLLLLHRHRWIVFRRVFIIMGVLYFMRSITMFVTQVPVASTTYYCSPKANSTNPLLILKRVLQLFSGFGLSINGQHTFCGDYIYSGHTVILTLCYLIIKEYSPQRCKLLHLLFMVSGTVGVFLVLLARGHYTVDVVIGYYVTTRVFWFYHTLTLSANSKCYPPTNTYASRVWWFPLFWYFERNVICSVPRQYAWPLPWPRRWLPRTRIS